MPRFRDPNAPAGRVVFGGIEFVNGVSADIKAGPETTTLFASAGISAEPEQTPEPAPAPQKGK